MNGTGKRWTGQPQTPERTEWQRRNERPPRVVLDAIAAMLGGDCEYFGPFAGRREPTDAELVATFGPRAASLIRHFEQHHGVVVSIAVGTDAVEFTFDGGEVEKLRQMFGR